MGRLNIGCGPRPWPDGWVVADVVDYGQPYVCDVGAMPFDSGEFEIVVAHHVLQMVAWPDLVPALVECRRVLDVGGVLRVSVPDLPGAVAAWRRGDSGWFPIHDDHESSVDGKLCLYVSQAGASRSVFTRGYLVDLLLRAGFSHVQPTRAGQTGTMSKRSVDLDGRSHESIYVEGVNL